MRVDTLGAEHAMEKALYTMELERINFMLRSYLRDRLRKVTKLSMHLVQEENEDERSRLSETESEFVSGYVNLYQQHIDRSVWDTVDTDCIPEKLKDISKTPSLAVTPKLDSH